MKKKVFRVLESILFLALVLCLVIGTSKIVERKESVAKIQPFLEQAEEYDVLFVGDSHSLNGIFPMELWNDYGIASYNLASIGSSIPLTYWTLMNALDYASPELIVIGIKDVGRLEKLTASSGDAHTALDGFPLTRTKLRAIDDLMNGSYEMDDAGDTYDELKWEYVFTLGKYHARWSELTRADFFPEYNVQLGGQMAVDVAVPNDYDIIDENLYAEESGWGFAYLRMMIEECQSRGIEVLLVHLPYPSTEAEQMEANTVYYIAQEYGKDFVDFVYLDQVVDYKVDCFDSYSHLNPSGARKVTDYLGRYIVDYYDIEDRRGDPAYAHWAEDYADYVEYKTAHLRMQGDVQDLLMLLHDDGFSVKIAVAEGAPVYADDRFLRLMHNIVREHIFEEDMFSKWSDSLFPLAQLDAAAQSGEAYFLDVDRETGAVMEYLGSEAKVQEQTHFAGQSGEGADVRVLIVNELTGETVAVLHY